MRLPWLVLYLRGEGSMSMSTIGAATITMARDFLDVLAELDVTLQMLHINTRWALEGAPVVHVLVAKRSDFMRVCEHLGKAPTEAKYQQLGQRRWWLEHDTDERSLLIECVSFKHHDDWEEK
jgi:hypothetical protein